MGCIIGVLVFSFSSLLVMVNRLAHEESPVYSSWRVGLVRV